MSKSNPGLQFDNEANRPEAGDTVHVDEGGPSLPEILTDDFVQRFEKGVGIYKRWQAVCLKLTTEQHWVNHGTADTPKFSLQGPGAEALCNPLGIEYREDDLDIRKELYDDERGEFYVYWVRGNVRSKTLGRGGFYVGYCDSRDPFLNARPGWTPATGQGDVMKSAMTNWLVNAVSRVAGIRNPDPKQLTAAGLKLDDIPRIDYQRNKGGGSKGGGKQDPATDNQLNFLHKELLRMKISTEAMNAKLASFGSGIVETTQLSKQQASDMIEWAKSGGKDNGGNPA